MAIRRVSDLPELSTTYREDFDTADKIENFAKCLFEVSYDHTPNIYQSFYAPASMLKAYFGKDDGKFVTIASDQEITGAKTFTSLNGLSINVSDGTYGGKSGAIKGITLQSADIADEDDSSTSSLVPSPKAIRDYVSALYLPLTAFGDVPTVLDMLCSLVSPMSITCYVDPVDGSDSNDGSIDNPFLTISAAISKINKHRFIENTNAYIRLLNDYCVSSTEPGSSDKLNIYKAECYPNVIEIYHPDMIQQRNIYIQGWDKDTDVLRQRTLSANATKPEKNNRYWFRCWCNVYFENCTFDNGIPFIVTAMDFHLSAGIKNDYQFYTIAGTDNVGAITIKDCMFKNCSYALHANVVNTTGINMFLSCDIAIDTVNGGAGRSSLGNTLYCRDCNQFARASINAINRYSNTNVISYLMLAIAKNAFSSNNAGTTIIYDSIKTNYDNTHRFWISYINGLNNNNSPTYEKVTQPNSSTIDSNVLKYTIGRESGPQMGYDDNGYINFAFKTAWLNANLTKNKISLSTLANNLSASTLSAVLSADIDANKGSNQCWYNLVN